MTGVELFVVEALPSWPLLFRPQHSTAPSERSAQVWNPPALTAVAETLLTTILSGALVWVPSLTVMLATWALLIWTRPPAVETPFVNVIGMAVPKGTALPLASVAVLVPVPPAKVMLWLPSL
jgi:hypothetical protein